MRGPQHFLNGTDEQNDTENGEEEERSHAEDDTPNSTEATDQLSETVFEQEFCNTARIHSNSTGWCWVTGVPGKGDNCSEAMADALDTLQGIFFPSKNILKVYIIYY